MNDKVDSRADSSAAAPVAVVAPAAHGAGMDVRPRAASADPERGFANDQAVAAYREAMILFQAQRYSEAMLGFSGFLERYADHPMAGSAQFYVGESYFRQGEYKLAHQEFSRVMTSYDRSPKVPDTLHRLAELGDLLKRPDEALKYRQMLMSMFPNSPAAAPSGKALPVYKPVPSRTVESPESRGSNDDEHSALDGKTKGEETARAPAHARLDGPPPTLPRVPMPNDTPTAELSE